METFIWTMVILHFISFGINLAEVEDTPGLSVFGMLCNLAIAIWAFVLVI